MIKKPVNIVYKQQLYFVEHSVQCHAPVKRLANQSSVTPSTNNTRQSSPAFSHHGTLDQLGEVMRDLRGKVARPARRDERQSIARPRHRRAGSTLVQPSRHVDEPPNNVTGSVRHAWKKLMS